MELKPCPFCGGTPWITWLGVCAARAECDCGAEGPFGNDDAEAAQLWNERAGVD
jgi:Lar family restriction alleviation protein